MMTPSSMTTALAGLAALGAWVGVWRLMRRRDPDAEGARLVLAQVLSGQRTESETLRRRLEEAERALLGSLAEMTTRQAQAAGRLETLLAEGQGKLREVLVAERDKAREAAEQARTAMEGQLRLLREGNERKLGEIQTAVNDQLHAAVEKQMTASFARVAEQFAAVQKAMGDVQAVTAQIGDIKRLFGNVKTRGGWGETQLRAILDDMIPGCFEVNWAPDATRRERVDFAVVMPMRGPERIYLPVDAKFPTEDYDRLVLAAEAGDGAAEREARAGLATRIRGEARRIAEKYIVPPATVEFAVLYVPTDGLYAEVARVPGLIDDLGREYRVLVLGPSLFPALLRTIQLGQVTLALEQRAGEIGRLLGATKAEMEKMDQVLGSLAKQASTFGNTIDKARTRTRAVARKLREIEATEEPGLLGEADAADEDGVGEPAA